MVISVCWLKIVSLSHKSNVFEEKTGFPAGNHQAVNHQAGIILAASSMPGFHMKTLLVSSVVFELSLFN